ncbi:MAG: hypothetical protein HY720_18390 [Planctomycetes bacterium]|nr:hypothetical protein [Planctomycetota bacterium]
MRIADVIAGLLVAALLAFGFLPPAAGQENPEKYTLAFRFQTGERFRYDITTRRESRWPGEGGFGIGETVEEIEGRLLEVLEGGGGQMAIRITQERVRQKHSFNQPGLPGIEFDSQGMTEEDLRDAARRDPRVSSAAALLGQSYVVRIDESGEILAVEGLESYMAKVAEEASRELSEADSRALAEEIARGGQTRMKEGLGTAFSFLPDAEVARGESWKSRFCRFLLPSGKVVEEVTLTLDEVKDGRAAISYASKPAFENARPIVPPSLLEDPEAKRILENLNMEASELSGGGKIEFDLVGGRLVRLEAPVRFLVTMKLPFEGTEEMPPIIQEIVDTRTIELVEILPRQE